ncbi:MAG: hypothetical protein ACFFGZ_08950 [Candidatus Thorarchaeota archaeon]
MLFPESFGWLVYSIPLLAGLIICVFWMIMLYQDFNDLNSQETLDNSTRSAWRITLLLPLLGIIAYTNVIKHGRQKKVAEGSFLSLTPLMLLADGGRHFPLWINILVSVTIALTIAFGALYLGLFDIATRVIGQEIDFSDKERLHWVWICLLPVAGALLCLHAIRKRSIHE